MIVKIGDKFTNRNGMDMPFSDMTKGVQYTVTAVSDERVYFHDDDGDERNISYEILNGHCYIVQNFPRGSTVVCIGLLDVITFSSMTIGGTYTITESKFGSVDWIDDVGDSCSEYLENVSECFRLVEKSTKAMPGEVEPTIQLEVDIIRSLMKSVKLPVTEYQAGVILDLMTVYAQSVQPTTIGE